MTDARLWIHYTLLALVLLVPGFVFPNPKLTPTFVLNSPDNTLPVYVVSTVKTDNFLELETNRKSSM